MNTTRKCTFENSPAIGYNRTKPMLGKCLSVFGCAGLVLGAWVSFAAGCPAEECRVRDGIARSAAKLAAGGDFTVAYLGGSITLQRGWRVKYTDWLQKRFPKARVKGVCAGLSGTGSGVGVFRMDEEVLAHDPDLLFVEFATNDTYINPTTVRRAMEGIVRKTWRRNPETDIVFVYTIADHMTNCYLKGECPRAATAHEAVADRYGVPSLCFGVRVADLLKRGKLVMGLNAEAFPVPAEMPDRADRVRDLLAKEGRVLFSKDGTHPMDDGHALYLDCFTDSFDRLTAPPPADHAKRLSGAPLDVANYERAKFVPLDRSVLVGSGWRPLPAEDPKMKKFGARTGPLWHSATVGDSIVFRFRGTSFGVYDLIGPDGCRLEVLVDGETAAKPRDRYNHWTKKSHMFLPEFPFAACADGEHAVELRITPRCDGATAFCPSKLMIVGDLLEESTRK